MRRRVTDCALELYEAGKTDREISETFGVTKCAVTNWRKKRGLTTKIGQRRRGE